MTVRTHTAQENDVAAASWLDPGAMPGMLTDEAGGKSRAELESLLDELERASAGLPFIVARTRQMAAMLDHVRLCLHPAHMFAHWTRDKDLLDARFVRRLRGFVESMPGLRCDRAHTNGAYIATLDRFHTCPDWESILSLGPLGIAERARRRRETTTTPDERLFLGCVIEVYEAFARLLRRWADFAERIGSTAVAVTLRPLAERPPRTFREALQLAIIYDHCQEMENESVRSQGLFDRLFIDFYRRDLVEGRETRESAKALVKDWFLRLRSLNGGNPGKNIGLGGRDATGTAVWNELDEICFEVHYELAMPSPKLTYRFGESTPREQLETVTKCLADGRTSIVFANDDVLAESFRRRGKTPDEIANYVLIGCYEPGIMGREIISSMACQINLAKPVEAVFNNGCDFDGFRIGPECALPEDSEAFVREYLRQAEALVHDSLHATRVIEERWADLNPSPLLSGAFRDCIEKAADISRGGAKYNQSGCVCMGLPTVADSLAAVKWIVDETRQATMAELGAILRSNWKDREPLRLAVSRTAPKWGNNDDCADGFAKTVMSAVARQINATRNGHGGTYQAGFWTIDIDMAAGETTGATPDGRRAGDPIARNNSATAGCGREGVTALMLSNAKLDLADAPDGHILDAIIPATLARGATGPAAIAALLRTYFRAGGQSIHVNCFDAALLRDAMAHPERYADLQVRVCGWNVLWNNLSRREQEHFLATAAAQEGSAC